MNKMKLPFRHRIRNSSPSGLRPITLPLGHAGFHNTGSLRVSAKDFLVSLNPRAGNEPAISDFPDRQL